MRLKIFLQLSSIVLLGSASAFAAAPDAAPVSEPAAMGAPPAPPAGYAPPPAGYAPPPPGYAPPGYEAPPLERTANNALYIEGLGPGLLYSLNFEHDFGDIAPRIGFSYLSLGASSSSGEAHATFMTIPLTISYLGIGSKKHMFEVGAGATVVYAGAGSSGFGADSTSDSATRVIGDLIFGYRLQPPQGGFMLRTGLSPVFGQGVFLPWPYLSLGAAF